MSHLFPFSQLTTQAAQTVFWYSFGLYCVNLAVGVAAQLRLYHFGRAHHVLYFVVCVSAGAALVTRWHPAMLLTVLALACIPTTKPRSKHGSGLHVVFALVGFLGYSYSAAAHLGWMPYWMP
jgi:hypothetical protein